MRFPRARAPFTAAADDLSEWAFNSDLEDLGIQWCWDEWPEIADELEPASEQAGDKILHLQADLKTLEAFKSALDKAAEVASDYSMIIRATWGAKYGCSE